MCEQLPTCRECNECRTILVLHNLQLVPQVAQRYRGSGPAVMDLVQEGNAALIHAVDKFDWRKGVWLRTYAAYWIKNAIGQYVMASRSVVRPPRRLAQRVRAAAGQSEALGWMEPVSADANERNGACGENAPTRQAAECCHKRFPITAALGDAAAGIEGDLGDAPRLTEEEYRLLQERLSAALRILTPDEAHVVVHRFGLRKVKPRTLSELGAALNTSPQRIQQIQIRALRKLNRLDLRKTLLPFL